MSFGDKILKRCLCRGNVQNLVEMFNSFWNINPGHPGAIYHGAAKDLFSACWNKNVSSLKPRKLFLPFISSRQRAGHLTGTMPRIPARGLCPYRTFRTARNFKWAFPPSVTLEHLVPPRHAHRIVPPRWVCTSLPSVSSSSPRRRASRAQPAQRPGHPAWPWGPRWLQCWIPASGKWARRGGESGDRRTDHFQLSVCGHDGGYLLTVVMLAVVPLAAVV